MNKIINFLKTYLLFFVIFSVYLTLISIIFYFELLSYKIVNIINYIFMIVLFFLLGLKITKFERKKGYLNGFLVSSMIVFIFLLLSLIISKINFSSLVYYLSLIISSMIGGILRANIKRD